MSDDDTTQPRYPTPWSDGSHLTQRKSDDGSNTALSAELEANQHAGRRWGGLSPAKRRAMPRSFVGHRWRWNTVNVATQPGAVYRASEIQYAGKLPLHPGEPGNEHAANDRPQNAGAQELYGLKFPTINGGWVRLEDYMGSDAKVADHARMSTQTEGQKPKHGGVEHLLRYMMRHRHTSPFEFAVVVVHVRCPVHVARQWIRHRTGTFSEVSARYVELTAESYCPAPDELAFQSTANHQGRAGALPDDVAARAHDRMSAAMKASATAYKALLGEGMSREQARIVLPIGTFTEFRWKVDLHNLLHFLSLRLDEHAQDEMRSYALALCEIVQAWMPLSFAAWREYTFNAVRLGELEHRLMLALLHKDDLSPENAREAEATAEAVLRLGVRERAELAEKLGYTASGLVTLLESLRFDASDGGAG